MNQFYAQGTDSAAPSGLVASNLNRDISKEENIQAAYGLAEMTIASIRLLLTAIKSRPGIFQA